MAAMNEVQLGEAYRLLVTLIEGFLQIKFCGFQSGGGIKSDLIMFAGPALNDPGNLLHGKPSTLAVPVDVMMWPQKEAREECLLKWNAAYLEARRTGSDDTEAVKAQPAPRNYQTSDYLKQAAEFRRQHGNIA